MSNHWQLKRLVFLGGSLGVGLVVGLLIIMYINAGNVANAAAPTAVTNPLGLVYRFSGVADDGAQGQPDRKIATSVHCTNIGPAAAQVELQVYDFSGTTVYTASLTLSPGKTRTVSTQGTAVYFEDALFGGLPGTNTINQGSGQILSSTPTIICTAQMLDPLTLPPLFVTRLKMFHPDGTPVGDGWKTYLPAVLRP